MRWVEHEDRLWEIRGVYRVLVWTLREIELMGDPGIDGGLI
jgi:hypothetical protein